MRPFLFLGLGFGVVCMSWGAVLIRLADAPPFVIAAYRLSLTTGILLPFALLRSGAEFRRLSLQSWCWGLLSGALLAVHFAAWISSLTYTSVASSVVLVSTYPIFVGLTSHRLTGERASAGMMAGILVAFIGGGLIGYGDFKVGGDALFGDGLALLGALSGAGYFMIGRRLRGHLSLLTYIMLVYAAAALFLTGLAVGTGCVLTGYSWTVYAIFLGLALGPQLLGHSSLNWALKYLSAAFVSVSTLGEPVGASLLAFLILGEPVSSLKLLGGALVLAGIYLALREERSRKQ